MDDASAGLYVYFTLDNTPDYDIDATEQDWTTSTILSSENNVNFFDSTSNELYLTGCQLEVGDTPSDFEFLPFDVQLARCQRYYYQIPNVPTSSYRQLGVGSLASASLASFDNEHIVPMRAAPTITEVGSLYTSDHVANRSFAVSTSYSTTERLTFNVTTASASNSPGTCIFTNNSNAGNYLTVSAEL